MEVELEFAVFPAWPGNSTFMHRTLDKGGAVLLRCRGGQGRSGMIALRLLVERGADGYQALLVVGRATADKSRVACGDKHSHSSFANDENLVPVHLTTRLHG